MKKRLTMFFACLFLSMGVALAQTKVNGTVISQDDGEPVVGASVLVVGTSTGTVTNSDGQFSLTVPAGKKTLRITYVGMEPIEVSARANMRILLTSDQKALDEVIVVAFGQQKKSSFTGSASQVGAAELDKHVTTNVANALVGSVPGLQIRGGSGQPGASEGKINIRGIASMYASTDPLIIVDGAPYPASLSNIAQEDIESVNVLKDAASAALYGARGAAGVILITTKKGNKQKPSVNVNMRWGANSRAVQEYDKVTNPAQYYEMAYSQFYNYYLGQDYSVADANAQANKDMISALGYQVYTVPNGQNLIGTDGKMNPNATLGYAQLGSNGETYWYQPDDWTEEAYKTGFRQEYDINLSGGYDRGDYFISAAYLNEDGIIDNSSFRRLNARLKANYDITKWLRAGINVGYTNSKTVSNPNNDEYQLGSTNLSYYTSRIAPIYPLYVRVLDANGNPIIRTDSNGNPQYDYGRPGQDYPNPRAFLQTGNPLGSNKYNDLNTRGNQLNGTLSFDIKFTDWLRFNSTNTINWGHTNYSKYDSQLYGPKVSVNGEIAKYQNDSFRQNYIQTLNFNRAFGAHSVQITLGHEWYDSKATYLTATAQGLFSPDIQEINAAANQQYKSGSYTSEYNVEGYFGRALYNYQEKYFADASIRRDASSRFAKENRWGTFWSAGAGWLINKEKFMNGTKNWLDQLKLKFSIGQNGNDGLPFAWAFTDIYSLSPSSTTQMNPSFSRLGNTDITWETTTSINLGIDFALFKNRLTGTIEYYNKKTTDLLFWVSVPESFGARGYYGNVGDKRSTGVELTLNGDIIRTKNIKWSVNLNITHNKEKILKLPAGKIAVNGGFAETWIPVSSGATSGSVQMWYNEGGSLYQPFLYAYAGVNDKGEALYWYDEDLSPLGGHLDEKGDPITNNTAKAGQKYSGTTTEIGKATRYAGESMLPKAYGGFGTTLEAYGFDLSVNFDYQLGGKIYDRQYQSLMSNWVTLSDAGSAFHKDLLASWTPTNINSSIPRFQYADQYTTASSDRWLTSASYLNFQSFSVGYTLPKNIVSKIGLSKIRVYATGENLCFWSKRKGLDPRYDYGATEALTPYSLMRTIMGGIQVSF